MNHKGTTRFLMGIMKSLRVGLATVIAVLCCIMLAGCGHNVYMESETMGFKVLIPVGDASLGVMIGSSKTVTATVRGGASFETTTSAGGGLLSAAGGQNKITQFKSNLQINEGNFKDVMVDPNVPDAAKVEMAKAIQPAAQAPYFPGYVMQTRDATIHLGRAAIMSNAVERLDLTGVDKALDVTGNVVQNAVDNVSGVVTGTVHDLTNPLEGTVGGVKDTVTEVRDTITSATDSIKSILYLALVIAAVVFLFVIIALFSGRKRKHLTEVNANPDAQIPPPTRPGELIEENVQLQEIDQNPSVAAASNRPESRGPGPVSRLVASVVKVVKTIMSLLALVPAPVRAKAVKAVVEWWKKRQAAKTAAKVK